MEKVERYDIFDSLILNFDQTLSKYVPVAFTTLAKRNSKQVCIKGSDDKRSITATFNITMDGITKQMDDGKSVEEIDVKLQLTRLKPLHAE